MVFQSIKYAKRSQETQTIPWNSLTHHGHDCEGPGVVGPAVEPHLRAGRLEPQQPRGSSPFVCSRACSNTSTCRRKLKSQAKNMDARNNYMCNSIWLFKSISHLCTFCMSVRCSMSCAMRITILCSIFKRIFSRQSRLRDARHRHQRVGQVQLDGQVPAMK